MSDLIPIGTALNVGKASLNTKIAALDAKDASLQSQITTEQQDRITALSAHIQALVAHAASAITLSTVTGMTASDVQAGIAELRNLLTTIIAGPAPSAEEIIAARVGADGVARASLDLLIKEIHAKQIAAADQSTTLTTGLNVVTSDQASPLKIVAYGQTRVNVIGSDGNCESLTGWATVGTVSLSTTQKKSGSNSFKLTSSGSGSAAHKEYSYPLDTTKYYVLAAWVYIESRSAGTIFVSVDDIGTFNSRYKASAVTSTIGSWQLVYVKIPTGNTLVGTGFRLEIAAGSTPTSVVYFDSIRIVPVSATEYAAVGTTITGDAIDALIPHVDGVKHTRGVAIISHGINQAPSTDGWEQGSIEPTTGNVSASTTRIRTGFISVLPNKSFTFSRISGYGFIIFEYTNAGVFIGISGGGSWKTANQTFTTSATTGKIRIIAAFGSGDATTIDISEILNIQPQLQLGTVATPFVEYAPTSLIADVTLASNVEGTVRDQLYRQGTDLLVLRKIKTGEALTITSNVATLAANATADTAIIEDTTTGEVYQRVTTLSGSGNEFTQGGTGNKTITFNASDNPTTPVAAYQLATVGAPENVTDKVEGSLSIPQGTSVVEVQTGVVRREAVTPYLSGSTYYINAQNASAYLSKRASSIIAVYKDADKDTLWTLLTNGTANGTGVATLPSADYDATKEYTATYFELDKYLHTVNITEIAGSYKTNQKTVVDGLVVDMANANAEISIHDWILAEHTARLKALEEA